MSDKKILNLYQNRFIFKQDQSFARYFTGKVKILNYFLPDHFNKKSYKDLIYSAKTYFFM